jgi:hypothetical protein
MRWSLKQYPKVMHRLLSNFATTLHSITRVFSRTYNWGGSGGALNIVILNTYISESSSPIALKFLHNVAFEYGRADI